MVQEQLVDYVSSQMKLGVSRDAIKSALVTAGWVPGDVEDTIKKVEGSSPVSASVSSASISSLSSSPAKNPEPQMIRVSDLVSSSASTSPAPITSPSTVKKDTPKIDPSKLGGKISGNTFEATTATSPTGGAAKSKMPLILEIVGGIIILALIGLAWYFYSGNASLAAQVKSLNSQSGSVSQQLSGLQTQMEASDTDFESQITQLQAADTDLALNLSFYAVAPGDSTSSTAITVNGTISGGGKAPYALTTARGAKIYVANSSDASTSATLKPLVGQMVQLTGMYVPGSDEMTVQGAASSTVQ